MIPHNLCDMSQDDKDIRRRIREGTQRRVDEQKKQRAYEETVKQEKDEDEASRVDLTQNIVCFVISLLFLSLPLTEPEVKWVEVCAFAVLNFTWTVFFHRKTFLHFATMIMLNLLLVQWSSRLTNVPLLLASLPVVPTVLFLLANAAGLTVGFLWYVNKATLTSVRAERWDYLLAGIVVVDMIAMLACGAVPLVVVYDAYKGLLRLLAH